MYSDQNGILSSKRQHMIWDDFECKQGLFATARMSHPTGR